MRKIIIITLLLYAGTAIAGDYFDDDCPRKSLMDYKVPGPIIIYPTEPGRSSRDFTKPGWKIVGDKIYPTKPGTSSRDFTKPGWKIVGDKIYPTEPGRSSRDFSKPGWKFR